MRIFRAQRDHQSRQRLRQRVLQRGIVGHENLGQARQFGGGRRLGADILAGDQPMHRAQLGGGGDGGAGRLLHARGVEVENHERGHGQITFASLRSLSTSAATSATLTPALRGAGSATLIVVRRGAGSTPRSAGLIVSIAFLRAFMMFGSEA